MARARRPPGSVHPWPCGVLAIDPASTSGWSYWMHGLYRRSGEVNLLNEPEGPSRVLREVAELHASLGGGPVVLVFELPFRGTRQGGSSMPWKMAFVAAGFAKSKMVGVYPAEWRAQVLACGGGATRSVSRRHEQDLARGYIGRTPGGDEAPAVCIGKWGSHAGKVGAKLTDAQKRQ